MWIDRVVELEPGCRLVAIKNVSMAEEHLHDHFAPAAGRSGLPVMPGSLIIEGVAQAGGVLVGHAHGFREKVVLAKVSRVELSADVVPGQTLRYTVSIQQMDSQGAATVAAIEVLDSAHPEAGWQNIGRVELMFSHLDKNMSGLEFPKHNFVFSDSFRTLLTSSGIACTF